jgi:signal transduction histidine kinase/DNA-binding response OmpR family regulator
MNVNDSLRLLTQLFFVLLGFVTTANYFRYRGKTRRDIALMSGSLAVPFFIELLERTTGLQSPGLDLFGVLCFLTQPYLLLNLAHYFHPIPFLVRRVAFVAMLASGVAVIGADVLSSSLTLAAGLAVVAYFVAIDGYAMGIFVQGTWVTSGVVQKRLRLAAAGSGFFALALLFLGLASLLPTLSDELNSLLLLLGIVSALSYTVGFVPPRWLQRAWQLAELQNYLGQINKKGWDERLNVAEGLDALCHAAIRATSGSVAAISQQGKLEKQWVIRHAIGHSELINHVLDDVDIINRVQHDHAPAYIRISQPLSPGDRHLLELVGADTLLVTPIAAAERDWGLLLLFMPRSSLFIEDDLSLVRLIAQQSAMFLENIALIETMRHDSATLEQTVAERTAEVRQLNLQLERRVLERTADLSHANAELGKVVRAKDEFLANMSHELRTPLNGILILTEVLIEQIRGPLNERQLDSLHTIQASGHHLLSLINDILDLSKIEAGKLELKFEPVIINDICRSSLQFVKELAHRKQLRLTFSNDNLEAQIQSDPRRLKQILINLLSNAVKFTPNGGQVSLKLFADEAENIIRFVVQDTGIGIPAADMPQLFKPFTQLDSGLTREHEGTGLGLTLVSRLVELHGGSIEVESAGIPGEGSSFTVSLPWHNSSEKSEDLPVDITLITNLHQTLRRLVPQAGEPFRAIIIEDSPTAAEQIDRYLKEMGFDVTTFVSGEQAIETVLKTSPHLIILDLLMPDQSGWDVLDQLKADPAIQSIPVIIISVVDEPARGLAAGAIEYLVKPITREQLRLALLQVVTTLDKRLDKDQVALSHPPVVEESATSEPQGPLVLLAEDNETNIMAIGDYLRAAGYRLVVAHHGGEVMELVLSLKPDLILMDIQMPVLDGLTVMKRLRAISEFATTPIIALTALAMPGDRERCLATGANEYLSKPVSLKRLHQVMVELLNGN